MSTEDGNSITNMYDDLCVRLQKIDENLKKARELGQENSASSASSPRTERLNTASRPVFFPSGRKLPPTERWGLALKEMSKYLGSVMRGTESEFLSTGSRLQEYYTRAKKISEASSFVAKTLSDNKLLEHIDTLEKLLKEIREHRYLFEQETARSVEKLKRASEALANAGKTSHAGRGNLTGRCDALRLEIESLTKRLQAHRLAQAGKSASVIEGAGLCLDSLKDKCSQANKLMAGVTRMSDGVRTSMENVIESLQFHDITRQRVEHVQKSISLYCKSLEGAKGAGQDYADGRAADFIAEAAAYCRLQVEQLTCMKEELDGAIGSIGANLRELARDAGLISGATIKLTNGVDASHSFLSDLGTWLTTVNSAIADLSENSRSRRDVMSEFKTVARDASRLQGEIESDSVGMSVLSKAVAMAASAVEDCCGGSAVKEGGWAGRMSAELGVILNSLRGINGSVLYKLNLLGAMGQDLSNDIEKAVGGLSVHETVSGAVAHINNGLDEIISEAASISPAACKRLSREEEDLHSFHAPPGGRRLSRNSGGRLKKSANNDDDNVEIF